MVEVEIRLRDASCESKPCPSWRNWVRFRFQCWSCSRSVAKVNHYRYVSSIPTVLITKQCKVVMILKKYTYKVYVSTFFYFRSWITECLFATTSPHLTAGLDFQLLEYILDFDTSVDCRSQWFYCRKTFTCGETWPPRARVLFTERVNEPESSEAKSSRAKAHFCPLLPDALFIRCGVRGENMYFRNIVHIPNENLLWLSLWRYRIRFITFILSSRHFFSSNFSISHNVNNM